MISRSETESRRFEMNIYRSKLETFKSSALKKAILDNNCDILILRVPSENKASHCELLTMGFPVLHADSLLYYYVHLKTLQIQPFKNDLLFEEINADNVHHLASMIPIIFDEYQNHYYSNPRFDSVKIKEGYTEWAASYHNEVEGRKSWLVK